MTRRPAPGAVRQLAVLTAMFAWLVWFCRRVCGSLAVAAGLGGVHVPRPVAVAAASGRRRIRCCCSSSCTACWTVRNAGRGWLAGAAGAAGAVGQPARGFPAGWLLIGCFVAAARRGGRGAAGGRRHCCVTPPVAQRRAAVAGALPAGERGGDRPQPLRPAVYQFVGHTSGRASARRIDEWVPPRFDQWVGGAFFVSLLWLGGLYAAAWWRGGRRPGVRELCLVPASCRWRAARYAWSRGGCWRLRPSAPPARAVAAGQKRRRGGVAALDRCGRRLRAPCSRSSSACRRCSRSTRCCGSAAPATRRVNLRRSTPTCAHRPRRQRLQPLRVGRVPQLRR